MYIYISIYIYISLYIYIIFTYKGQRLHPRRYRHIRFLCATRSKFQQGLGDWTCLSLKTNPGMYESRKKNCSKPTTTNLPFRVFFRPFHKLIPGGSLADHGLPLTREVIPGAVKFSPLIILKHGNPQLTWF